MVLISSKLLIYSTNHIYKRKSENCGQAKSVPTRHVFVSWHSWLENSKKLVRLSIKRASFFDEVSGYWFEYHIVMELHL
jgi:hypothetical protein